jgi:hypothetical protein
VSSSSNELNVLGMNDWTRREELKERAAARFSAGDTFRLIEVEGAYILYGGNGWEI